MNYHIKNFIIPIHVLGLLAIIGIISGLLTFNWLLFLLGWTLIYGFGLVVGFHKLLSHNSFKTNKYVSYVLAYLGCLGISGSPIWWAATHRGYHHAHTESDKDLQTPRKGWLNSYIGWQFGDETSKISLKYAADLTRDKFYVFLHKNYRTIVWSTVIIVSIISPSVAISLLILPMLAAHHGENITNLFGHSRFAGYRNFDTSDDTINNPILALFTWGQLLHNNHHAKPNNSSFAIRWFEFDPTAPIVYLLGKLK